MSSVELVLYEEEFQRLDQALKKLRQEANARAIFLIDRTGQQIAAAGEIEQFDTTSLASLTAGNVAATDGLAEAVKHGAAAVVSLSALTLPHGLARVLLAEQLYRAASLLAGHPYHRD